MIPAAFTGGWVRQGLSVNGGPFIEDAAVWWLQTDVHHADLRIPTDRAAQPTSFAGVTTWDGSALTWTRQVDLEHFDGSDKGTMRWDGTDLIESGTWVQPDGSAVAYVERWVRLPGSQAPLEDARVGATHAVRAGDFAITVCDERSLGGTFRATAWIRSGSTWAPQQSLPGMPCAPEPAAILRSAAQ